MIHHRGNILTSIIKRNVNNSQLILLYQKFTWVMSFVSYAKQLFQSMLILHRSHLHFQTIQNSLIASIKTSLNSDESCSSSLSIQQKQNYMSFSITPSDVIRNHPANSSTAKEVHAFSRTRRFIAPNPQCPNAFYSYNSQLSNRQSSFGYGNKSDFTRTLTISPPSTKYEARSFLRQSRGKGKSFGLQREKLPNNSYLIPQMQKVPGPGVYENDKSKKMNYSYSLRKKPVDFIEKKLSYKESPGPGTHQDVELVTKKGRITVSKFSGVPYSVIHPKTERFRTIKDSPGPHNYLQGDSINPDAKYVLSHRRSTGRRAFSRSARNVLWKTNDTPGPGSYVETTQFGHYGNSKYYKTLGK